MGVASELLWEFRKNYVMWSADLVFRGESWGREARSLRGGEMTIGHRFMLKADAWRRAEMMRLEVALRERRARERQAEDTGDPHGGSNRCQN